MKKINELLKGFLICIVLAVGFAGCEETPVPESNPVIPGSHGVFILNEGSNGESNAGLSYYNIENGSFKSDILGGKLGDTGQDLLIYGGKLYISVSGSSTIVVLDVRTQETIKEIKIKNGEQARMPRYLESHGGKIYATCFDGNVIRLDTTSLVVEAIIPVGENPEGIAACNGKLYVANSGGLNFVSGPSKTVSVIDIASFKEDKKIEVGLNPYIIKADGLGDLYLSYQGNFYDIPGGFQRIDAQTGKVYDIGDHPKQNFTILDNLIYYYDVTYFPDFSTNISFGLYDVDKEVFLSQALISDGTAINTPYGIGVNPYTKEVYISDTDYKNPGIIHIFGPDGKKIKDLNAGINPTRFAFY
jgi:DNA-binding beta-propeller fold protein YncE